MSRASSPRRPRVREALFPCATATTSQASPTCPNDTLASSPQQTSLCAARHDCSAPRATLARSTFSSIPLTAAPSALPSSCTIDTLRSGSCPSFLRALKTYHRSELISFPQCALGSNTQKYTTLLVSPGFAPARLRAFPTLARGPPLRPSKRATSW
eukprot:1536479-Pleurochrysis_carterae.AAC.2